MDRRLKIAAKKKTHYVPVLAREEKRFVDLWSINANKKCCWVNDELLPIPPHVSPYLRDDKAVYGYGQIRKMETCFESKVDYETKVNFELIPLFTAVGCEKLLMGGSEYYPELVAQFFANGLFTKDKKFVKSWVKNKEIVLNCDAWGEIIGVPFDGINLSDISLKVAEDALKEGPIPTKEGLDYDADWMNEKARAINRISHNNIFPRLAHKERVRKEVVKLIFCILNGIRCNVASLMLSRFMECTSYIVFFPCYLTEVFQKFDIDLSGEKKKDNKAILNMGNFNRMVGQTSKKMGVQGRGKKVVQEEEEEQVEEEVEEEVSLANVLKEIKLVGAKVDYSIKYQTELAINVEEEFKGIFNHLDIPYEPWVKDLPNYEEHMQAFHDENEPSVDDEDDETYEPEQFVESPEGTSTRRTSKRRR